MEEMKNSCSDKAESKGVFRMFMPKHEYHGSPSGIDAMLHRMDGKISDRRFLLYLAVISAILFIAPVFFINLWDSDELRVAGIAAEMAVENDWLMPKLNGMPFLEYPPLFYAAAAANFRIFGLTSFAAKLPTAFSASAGVLMFYWMMRILRRSKCESFAGAFMLATGMQYLTNAYDCRVDMMLTAFCILIWTGFAMMEFSGAGFARRAVGMMMTGFGIAGAVLTKNLTGLAITLPGIACTIFFCDLAKRRFSFAAYCRLAGAVLLGMLPYALYLWLMYRKHGVDVVETVFWYNNFGRFSGSVADHSCPWWGYLESFYEYFPPYMPLMLVGMFLQIKACRKSRSPYGILSLSLLVIPFIVLSAASNKRQVYLLPLAAPAAMLAASTLPYVIYWVRKLFGRNVILPFRRRLKAVICAVTLLLALIMGSVFGCMSASKSLAPVFAEARRLRAVRGGRLVLMRPGERHLGASFFYNRTAVPEIKEWDELNPDDVAVAPLRLEESLKLPEGASARRFKKAKMIVISQIK